MSVQWVTIRLWHQAYNWLFSTATNIRIVSSLDQANHFTFLLYFYQLWSLDIYASLSGKTPTWPLEHWKSGPKQLFHFRVPPSDHKWNFVKGACQRVKSSNSAKTKFVIKLNDKLFFLVTSYSIADSFFWREPGCWPSLSLTETLSKLTWQSCVVKTALEKLVSFMHVWISLYSLLVFSRAQNICSSSADVTRWCFIWSYNSFYSFEC